MKTLRERADDPFASWQPTATGLLLPPKPKRRYDQPIAIDLFAGAGGFSLGLEAAGFHVVAALEYDATCMLTYLANLGAYPVNLVFIEPGDRERAEKEITDEYVRKGWLDKKGRWLSDKLFDEHGNGPAFSGHHRRPGTPGTEHYFLGDARKITGKQMLDIMGLERGDVDLVCGGPPCQGFSYMGKREVMDPRNSLVFDFARLVLEIRPKAMIMENVTGILSMVTPEGVPVLDALCRVLSDGGFGTYDALKKSLLVSAGAGAALRGGKGKDMRPADDDEENDDQAPAQLTMFEAAF